MTRQEGSNRSSSSGRERKRKAGTGWPVQAVRKAHPAGRGYSLVAHPSSSTSALMSIRASLPRSSRRSNEAQANGVPHGSTTGPVSPDRPMSHPANDIEASTRWRFGRLASPLNMATASGAPIDNGRRPARRSARGDVPPRSCCGGSFPSSRQPDDGDDDGHRRMFARAFSVFNIAQVDGYQRPTADILSESERLAHAEAFISNLGIRTVFEGSEACYRPSTDAVFMPPFASFPIQRRSMVSGFMRTVTPAAPSIGLTAISRAGPDLPPMPQKNAAWRFSAG